MSAPDVKADTVKAHIVIDNVSKVFETDGRRMVALENIGLKIPRGQFVCLLGPSGCGKSTLLNAIAGFAPPTQGRVLADGAVVAGPGPERGMVFQEYALFPWMTVEQNVGFGAAVD
jgi:NitT/TauT family transport system ATP-binding protein